MSARRRDEDPNRVFPLEFRTLVRDSDEGSRPEAPAPGGLAPQLLRFRCACGQHTFDCETGSARPLRCHCVSCRRYHTAAFAAFLPVLALPSELASASADGSITKYADRCHDLGRVDRVFCTQCRSTLATVAADGTALLALGCLDDESLSPTTALTWQREFDQQQESQRARWSVMQPRAADHGSGSLLDLHGGCACGGATYHSISDSALQLQHCYCKLCRQLSGSVGQTWIPMPLQGFEWISQESLELVRTTQHGQRHQCNRCGGVLTIVYDSQPNVIWPVAATVDEASMAVAVDEHTIDRVIHICCSMMQGWYELPQDGLPRLRFAG